MLILFFGVDTQKLDEYAGEQVIVLGINGACCLCPKSEQRRLLDALEVRENLDWTYDVKP